MNGKVSMVMTCYNKVDFIGMMLESVISQKWDNIELILVNDGSTDGTREVIAEYEPRIKARGYQCIIIDQENKGCCTALRNGLAVITGDYVCVVDSDDELDSEYVSTLAGFLEENRSYDYSICDKIEYTYKDGKRVYGEFIPRRIESDGSDMAELYLLNLVNPVSWVYMVRIDYFKECAIIENFSLSHRGSYEPSYNIPLLANRGKMKFFPLPLYRFHLCDVSHSRFKQLSDAIAFQEEYYSLCIRAIKLLSGSAADIYRKTYLIELAAFHRYFWLSIHTGTVPGGEKHSDDYLRKAFDLAADLLGVAGIVDYTIWIKQHMVGFEFIQRMLGPSSRFLEKQILEGRIIVLAAKSKKAQIVFPFIRHLDFYEFWDESAMHGDTLYGYPINKPDYGKLTEHDSVIVLTVNKKATEEINEKLTARGIINVYHVKDLL